MMMYMLAYLSEMLDIEDKQEKKRLETRLYKYEQKIAALMDTPKDSGVLDFSQLGIDFLMIDESMEFKNLEFSTTKKNVGGLGNPFGRFFSHKIHFIKKCRISPVIT